MAVNQLNIPQIHGAAMQTKGVGYRNALMRRMEESAQSKAELMGPAARGEQASIDALWEHDPTTAGIMDKREREKYLVGTQDLLAAVRSAKNPEMWESNLDRYSSEGVDVEKYRGRYEDRGLIEKRLMARLGKLGDSEKAFTLGPKQTRYDAAGNVIVGAKTGADARDPEDIFKQEGNLRGEFAKATKVFTSIRDSYGRIQAAAQDPSAAGDLALIFSYMKILDPGSVVRESEFANAANAAGVGEQVRALWNRVRRGERLGPEQRGDFVNRAGRLYQKQLDQFKKTETRYQGLAGQYEGVDPSRVTYDVSGGMVPNAEETKNVNGVDYYRIGSKWYSK